MILWALLDRQGLLDAIGGAGDFGMGFLASLPVLAALVVLNHLFYSWRAHVAAKKQPAERNASPAAVAPDRARTIAIAVVGLIMLCGVALIAGAL